MVGPILLGSAGYRKQGYYFVWPHQTKKYGPHQLSCNITSPN